MLADGGGKPLLAGTPQSGAFISSLPGGICHMETKKAEKAQSASSNKIIIIAAAMVIIALIIAIMVLLLNRDSDSNDKSVIGYAADASVMLDEASLQAAMDAAMENAANSSVALKYQDDAYSEDGVNFDCYIANSERNIYDMFLAIYADPELKDQLYLSELVRPGSGFEKLALDHALGAGDHTVYVAVTQVDTEEDGTQVMKNQVVHTMEFHVSE